VSRKRAALDDRDRRTIRLLHALGCPPDELARVLGVGVATIRAITERRRLGTRKRAAP
jgi:DNA-directed RNA polymerase specialized sigma24 family protein